MKDVVTIPLYIAIIVLNCIEVYLIAKKPQKKRLKSEKMLLSLSIGDVLLGFNGVIGFFREIKVIPSSRFIITFLNSFIIFSVTFSILHILLLTLDRFISVYYPIRRRTLMSDSLVNISLVFIWLFSLVTSPLIVWHSIAKKSSIYPVFLSVEVFPTLVVLLFVYIMIYRKLRDSVMFGGGHCEASASSANYNSSNLSSVSYVDDNVKSTAENEAPAGMRNKENSTSSAADKTELLTVTMTSIHLEEKDERKMENGPENGRNAEEKDSRQTTNGVTGSSGKSVRLEVQKEEPGNQTTKSRRHSTHAYKQEKRILMLGISIIISFAICFLPATITFLVFLRFTKKSMPYFVFSYFFAVLNSVSNPILYFFYRYWDRAKKLCGCCCCCC